MLEIYKLYWKNKHIGYIYHKQETDELAAKLIRTDCAYPRRLFGLTALNRVVGDKQVREYLDNTVVPKDRQNIDEYLKSIGVPRYDSWLIYKAHSGKNANDYCRIEYFKTVDKLRGYRTLDTY